MTCSISWLDHDSAADERCLRILSFFIEMEFRDELGQLCKSKPHEGLA